MVAAVRIAAIAGIAALCIYLYPRLTPQAVAAFMEEYRIIAPVLFVALCAARPVLFFLPTMGLTIVAGVLFGAFYGTIYVVIGGALSTAVGYFFAKWLGRGVVAGLVERSTVLREMEKRAVRSGGSAVLYMRLFNLPWDLVSYWAGLAGVNFRDFYLASLIPLVPVSFLYVYFGSTIFDPLSAGFIISLLIMFSMGALPYVMPKLRSKVNG